jgi:ribosomal protein S12 methylthiotransferase accessory factor
MQEQYSLQPIVFLGPSLSFEYARRILPKAEFRPPIKRGDLEGIIAPAIVGIIDGVFGESLAISPGEIRDAISRGVTIYGAGSMGALRASEIPKMIGVGRIYDMYKSGEIERDDEVALLFLPGTFQPMTVPMINLRYGVERLVRSTTLSREDGIALIEACQKLHFKERTYKTIINNSSLAHNKDADDIVKLLRNFDLKREDAQFLLEMLSNLKVPISDVNSATGRSISQEVLINAISNDKKEGDILIWESGDIINRNDLVRFLHMTGRFECVVRNTLARFAIAGTPLRSNISGTKSNGSVSGYTDAQNLLDVTRLIWGWESPEESEVTLKDLGLSLFDIAPSLESEVLCKQIVASFGLQSTVLFEKALQTELWMNDLMLKREVMRLGAMQYFSKEGKMTGPITEFEMEDAKRTICRLRMGMQWAIVSNDLRVFGVEESEQEEMIKELAFARRKARMMIDETTERTITSKISQLHMSWQDAFPQFTNSIKAEGSLRFSLSTSEAMKIGEIIAKQIGINRIGMIGELDTLGIHIAQAFGDRSGWSASFSSGKAETRDGARIGSIMEEVEIHAQDSFSPPLRMFESFNKIDRSVNLINPSTLDLPYDSRYSEKLEIEWTTTFDLLESREVLVPSASLTGERVANDIFYSPRLGGKIFSSSGLGSGFSFAEATVHASAELIERHAVKLAELALDNPMDSIRQFKFIEHKSLPETPLRIVEKYKNAGMSIRILDITPDIKIPTFYVRVYDDPFVSESSTTSDGFACHPDPEVAITMALLEAAQTKAGVIAGGREDYSLQARSLGRHERPRTMLPEAQVFWFCNDRPMRQFTEVKGFITRDILEELKWIIDRVHNAGLRHFIVTDIGNERIKPAFAVRVIIPGIESTNPLFTGERARAVLLGDLFPTDLTEMQCYKNKIYSNG